MEQLDNLIEEKEQDREDRRRRRERDKIQDKKDNRWMRKMKENVKVCEKVAIRKAETTWRANSKAGTIRNWVWKPRNEKNG